MKTSLGIWAFGPDGHPLRAGRLPAGAQLPGRARPRRRSRRAVDGLGDLIDGYEFHYPQELSDDNLDEVREALGEHDIYCMATGLHLDPRFGKGALSSPDAGIPARGARDHASAAADFAANGGRSADLLAGDRGLQLPVPDPLRALLGAGSSTASAEGGRALQRARHPPLPRAQELRAGDEDLHAQHRHDAARDPHARAARASTDVQVNMDWQHLLMNGENLGEYVALLAAEGLLGHQHANSGWGTFDDDNMVGATAFMETLELALELRRAGYGRDGDERRLGFDLYPYTEDQVGAVRRSVLQWRFIDETAGKIDAGALAEAQQDARTRFAPTSWCTRRSARGDRRRARRRHHLGQGARPRHRRRRRWWRAPRTATRSTRPGPAGPSRTRSCGGRPPRRCSPRCAGSAGELAGIGLSGQMHGLVALDAADRVLRPALLWNDQRTGRGDRGDRGSGSAASPGWWRLTGNRALTGFTAPKLLWMARHEPELYARVRSVMLPKDYVRLRLCGERATDVTDASGTLWFDVARARWSERVVSMRSRSTRRWLPRAEESPTVTGTTPRRRARGRRGGRPGGGCARRGCGPPGPGVGRARHVGRGVERAAGLRRRPGRAGAGLLPRGAGRAGSRWG